MSIITVDFGSDNVNPVPFVEDQVYAVVEKVLASVLAGPISALPCGVDPARDVTVALADAGLI